MEMHELSPEDRATLLRLRSKLADRGYEVTPDNYLELMERCGEMVTGLGGDILEVTRGIQLFDLRPPPPPYEGLFDDLAEAEDFRLRAELTHDIRLVVLKARGRKYKVDLVED